MSPSAAQRNSPLTSATAGTFISLSRTRVRGPEARSLSAIPVGMRSRAHEEVEDRERVAQKDGLARQGRAPVVDGQHREGVAEVLHVARALLEEGVARHRRGRCASRPARPSRAPEAPRRRSPRARWRARGSACPRGSPRTSPGTARRPRGRSPRARSRRPWMAFSATSNAPRSRRTSEEVSRGAGPGGTLARSPRRPAQRGNGAERPPDDDRAPRQGHLPGPAARASSPALPRLVHQLGVAAARGDEAADHREELDVGVLERDRRCAARRPRRGGRPCRGWGRRGRRETAPRRSPRSACTRRAARPSRSRWAACTRSPRP